MKDPKCKICGGPHYKTFCFKAVKKPIKLKTVSFTVKQQKPLRKAQIKPRSKNNQRKILIYELDKVFSVYIRYSSSIGGKARCVTCGTVKPWKEMHNGHFISRGKFATRWDEMNCHVQCEDCNLKLKGNLVKYRKYMISKYGFYAVQELQLKATTGQKITTPELRELITYYKNCIKNVA